MPDLITLTCPACGAKLKVTDQIHLLACRNCGNEFMVHRDAGSIYLAPLAADVRQIRVGVDKTAAELAMVRLTNEIAALDATLKEASQRPLNKWIPRGDGENIPIFVGLASFAIAVFAFSNGEQNTGILFVIVWLVMVISYFRHNTRRTKNAKALRQTTIQEMQETLDAKRKQLRTHRRVVDS